MHDQSRAHLDALVLVPDAIAAYHLPLIMLSRSRDIWLHDVFAHVHMNVRRAFVSNSLNHLSSPPRTSAGEQPLCVLRKHLQQ